MGALGEGGSRRRSHEKAVASGNFAEKVRVEKNKIILLGGSGGRVELKIKIRSRWQANIHKVGGTCKKFDKKLFRFCCILYA